MAATSQGARIIGATFAHREDAELAAGALEDMGISPINIQIVVQLNAHSAAKIYAEVLADRGFSAESADYYGRLIRRGRTLVAVYDVIDASRSSIFSTSSARNIIPTVRAMFATMSSA